MQDLNFRFFDKNRFVYFHLWEVPFTESFLSKSMEFVSLPSPLSDMANNVIYDGDIVRVKYNTTSWGRQIKYDFTGIVCYGEFISSEEGGIYDEILGWFIKTKDQELSLLNFDGNIRIIGNKFQNLGLLDFKIA